MGMVIVLKMHSLLLCLLVPLPLSVLLLLKSQLSRPSRSHWQGQLA